MASVDVRTVASLLREYAQRTALRGGNPYRAKAYSKAADSLTALAVPLDVLIAEDQLTEIPGVGEAIADIITKLHKMGTHPSLEKLRKEIPEGVLEMLSVPGLRPEKVLRLYKDLGVGSLAELEAAAKDGVPTFPVNIAGKEKRPAVRNYMKVGSVASEKLAKQFADASAFGLGCGRLTGLTILDVDCKDERVLADALARHGETPFVVRTGSGNFQAWYRHNGEKRQVRPWGKELPIDQLGDGYVVAPPSKGKRMGYKIVQGRLDDLANLPFMRNAWRPGDQARPRTAHEGERNKALWWHCMEQAHSCDAFDDLLDVAQTFNEDSCIPPLDDDEVARTAQSAWKYTQQGNNRIGRHGSWLTAKSVESLVNDPYALALLAWLQARNGPDATFWVADGLNQSELGWPRRKFQAARRKLVRAHWLDPLTKPKPGNPVEHRWGEARKQQ